MTRDLFTYVPLSTGTFVPSEEVESPRETLEVRILWGTTVLHVAHLTPPRSFYVGEPAGTEGECDYGIPGEVLGAVRLPVVVLRPAERVLVIPPGARGYVDAPGCERESLDDLVTSGEARLSGDWPGACEYDLPAGATARVELAGSSIVFQVALVNAGKRLPAGALSTLEPADFVYTASSFLLHAGLIAIFAFFMPKMGADDDAAIDRDNILAMKKLLNAAAAREEPLPDALETGLSNVEPERGSSAAARGAAGAMGIPATARNGRYAVEGPKDNPDPHFARDLALREARNFGAVEILGLLGESLPRAYPVSWGHETPSGRDATTAFGKMFGDGIDDAVGSLGLDLSGVEPGGGGYADNIGLNEVGPLAVGPGGPRGPGVGGGRGQPPGTHKPTEIRLRPETATVNGRLPPEVIQRTVRQNFGRFRFCYESALRGNPSLQGRVVVKFVIDRSGAVALSSDGGGDLPDRSVVACVVRAFADLSFTPPDGGMVTVVYPLVFNSTGEGM